MNGQAIELSFGYGSAEPGRRSARGLQLAGLDRPLQNARGIVDAPPVSRNQGDVRPYRYSLYEQRP